MCVCVCVCEKLKNEVFKSVEFIIKERFGFSKPSSGL